MADELSPDQEARLHELLTTELRAAVLAKLAEGADPAALADALAERVQAVQADAAGERGPHSDLPGYTGSVAGPD